MIHQVSGLGLLQRDLKTADQECRSAQGDNLEDKSNFKKVGFFVCIGSFPLHDHTLYFSKKFGGFPRQKWKTSHILPVTLHISCHIQSEHTFIRPTERFLEEEEVHKETTLKRNQIFKKKKGFYLYWQFPFCIHTLYFSKKVKGERVAVAKTKHILPVTFSLNTP